MGLAAPDAESLMRSRYTAFHLGLEQYLLETWHPDTRPVKINLSEEPKIEWLGLEVLYSKLLSSLNARVNFIAYYTINDKSYQLIKSVNLNCLRDVGITQKILNSS